jgi:hypothetical protein
MKYHRFSIRGMRRRRSRTRRRNNRNTGRRNHVTTRRTKRNLSVLLPQKGGSDWDGSGAPPRNTPWQILEKHYPFDAKKEEAVEYIVQARREGNKIMLIVGAVPHQSSKFRIPDGYVPLYCQESLQFDGYLYSEEENKHRAIEAVFTQPIAQYPLLIANPFYVPQFKSQFDLIVFDTGTVFHMHLDDKKLLHIFQFTYDQRSVVVLDNKRNIVSTTAVESVFFNPGGQFPIYDRSSDIFTGPENGYAITAPSGPKQIMNLSIMMAMSLWFQLTPPFVNSVNIPRLKLNHKINNWFRIWSNVDNKVRMTKLLYTFSDINIFHNTPKHLQRTNEEGQPINGFGTLVNDTYEPIDETGAVMEDYTEPEGQPYIPHKTFDGNKNTNFFVYFTRTKHFFQKESSVAAET